MQQLGNFIKSLVNNSDQQYIFTTVESSFRNFFNKQKAIHIRKLSLLHNQQNKVLSTSACDSKKFNLNLSKYILIYSEEAIFTKPLNFSVLIPHSNLDVACAVESVVFKNFHRPWACNSGGISGPC
jgi:hypothetical protein